MAYVQIALAATRLCMVRVHGNIVTATLRAVLSAVNRAHVRIDHSAGPRSARCA